MSFWKSLFGGGSSASESEGKPGAPVEYNGFTIRPAPYKAEGQYQTAGIITKEIGGIAKEHRFIRADRHASYDDAVEFSLAKARQIVDQQGERMFN
jgi:hypothetical protein